MSTPPQTDPPPPTNMSDWPSNSYWGEAEGRIRRRWYVSFCLMMTSVQDRLTGLALHESGNLNWATTAFYYSAVHAGRLVCFVCCGDYPKSHEDLAKILAPTQTANTRHPPRQLKFNWLDEFLSYVESTRDRSYSHNISADRARADLVAAIDATLPRVRSDFDRFAPLLAKFKNLRNDCNYEALLVAHEVNHTTVTDGFKELVAAAAEVSDLAVGLAVTAYSEHLQSAECFQAARDQFHAAHTHYLSGRFEKSLRQKFRDSSEAQDELRRLRMNLEWPETPNDIDVDAFLEPIMLGTFGEKRGLMGRWQNDIRVLHSSITAPG